MMYTVPRLAPASILPAIGPERIQTRVADADQRCTTATWAAIVCLYAISSQQNGTVCCQRCTSITPGRTIINNAGCDKCAESHAHSARGGRVKGQCDVTARAAGCPATRPWPTENTDARCSALCCSLCVYVCLSVLLAVAWWHTHTHTHLTIQNHNHQYGFRWATLESASDTKISDCRRIQVEERLDSCPGPAQVPRHSLWLFLDPLQHMYRIFSSMSLGIVIIPHGSGINFVGKIGVPGNYRPRPRVVFRYNKISAERWATRSIANSLSAET